MSTDSSIVPDHLNEKYWKEKYEMLRLKHDRLVIKHNKLVEKYNNLWQEYDYMRG